MNRIRTLVGKCELSFVKTPSLRFSLYMFTSQTPFLFLDTAYSCDPRIKKFKEEEKAKKEAEKKAKAEAKRKEQEERDRVHFNLYLF